MKKNRNMATRLLAAAALLLTASGGSSAMAQDQAGFQNYLSIIRAKAMASGVRPATLDNVLPSLTLNPRVIELDQSQPGGSFDSPIPPFEPYRLTHVDNARSEEHTSELQSLMRISYAVICLKKKNN